MAFFNILIHRLKQKNKNWWFDSIIPCGTLVLTAYRSFIGRNSPRHSRPSPSCCLNLLLARQKTPQILLNLEESSQLSLSLATFIDAYNLFPVGAHTPNSSNIHETSSATVPIGLCFLIVNFFAPGRGRRRSFKEVDVKVFLSIVYEDLAFSTPMGWVGIYSLLSIRRI